MSEAKDQAKKPRVNKAAAFLKLSKAEQSTFIGYADFLHQFLFDSIPDLMIDLAKQRGYTLTVKKPSPNIRKQADLNLAIIIYSNMEGGFPPELAYLICIGIWASSIRVKKDGEPKDSSQSDNPQLGAEENQRGRSTPDTGDGNPPARKNSPSDKVSASNGTGGKGKPKGKPK